MCLEYRTIIENHSQQSVLYGNIAVLSAKAGNSRQIANNRQQQQIANRSQQQQTAGSKQTATASKQITTDHNNRQQQTAHRADS